MGAALNSTVAIATIESQFTDMQRMLERDRLFGGVADGRGFGTENKCQNQNNVNQSADGK